MLSGVGLVACHMSRRTMSSQITVRWWLAFRGRLGLHTITTLPLTA
jgi:hypothetical protein